MNEISAPIEEKPERSFAFPIQGHSEETAVYEPGGGSHQTLNLLMSSSWTSQPPEP